MKRKIVIDSLKVSYSSCMVTCNEQGKEIIREIVMGGHGIEGRYIPTELLKQIKDYVILAESESQGIALYDCDWCGRPITDEGTEIDYDATTGVYGSLICWRCAQYHDKRNAAAEDRSELGEASEMDDPEGDEFPFIPMTIYLQTAGHVNVSDFTWCKDRINASDTEYQRSVSSEENGDAD